MIELRRIILNNFRIIDATSNFTGSLVVENGSITKIVNETIHSAAEMVIDGRAFGSAAVLMPAFIDLHAHFRDTGCCGKEMPAKTSLPEAMPLPATVPFPAEVVESAALAASAGGFTTVVCMANTKPVIDTAEKARALKERSDSLGLIDLYPVLSLSKNMEGRELSGIADLPAAEWNDAALRLPLMLSEDGKDVADDDLFQAALEQARRLKLPVSCHCDLGGEAAAVSRAIELGKKAGCHIHIAHVSTQEAAALIRTAKQSLPTGGASGESTPGFSLSCEATPHHIAATEADARVMGADTGGRVNPPLRSEADRQAVIAAINEGTIDAIATDHAPHSEADKAAGAPGFSGLETAFAACLSQLVPAATDVASLQRLSALMSAHPARILGLDNGPHGRGRIAAGLRADFVIVDTEKEWIVHPAQFKSRGRCSPFADRQLRGTIRMTIHNGRIVFEGD